MLVTLFSDASLCSDTKVGGWAAWLKTSRSPSAYRAGGSFIVQIDDITLAESMAVVNALASGLRSGVIQTCDEVLVQTDNNNVMGVLNGTTKRKKPSRRRRLKKGLSSSQARNLKYRRNREIKIISRAFLGIVQRHDLSIRWRHVKAHRGKVDRRAAVNTFCDETARAHMRKVRGKDLPTLIAMTRAKTKS